MSVRMAVRVWAIVLGAAIGWGLAGCAEPAPTAPLGERMAGVWNARTFTVGDGSTATDGLLAGGGMRLVLRADSTTGGTMWLPAEVTGDSVRAYDLAGTWTAGDSIVWLVTPEGYVQDMTLRRAGEALAVDDLLGKRRVRITLSR
jgi:hypothetical protein